jgi:hypothetical protein
MSARAEKNRQERGPMETLTGTVTQVRDLRAQSIVAFGLKHGREESVFWISTARQGEDKDYRRPLEGETVKVWFNDKAGTLALPGEGRPARGVCEIQNISGNAEEEAFAWFRRMYPECYEPKKPDGPK